MGKRLFLFFLAAAVLCSACGALADDGGADGDVNIV